MQDDTDISLAPGGMDCAIEEIDIGPVAQDAAALPVIIGDRRCFRIRGENSVRLLSATCPHMGGEVEDIGACFECPLHGWTFDKTTGRSLNAAGAALAEIETVERNGRVYARIPRRHAAADAGASRPIAAAPADLSIRLVVHSSLELRRGAFTLLTDPWLAGPAMLGSWTPYPPPLTQAADHHPDVIWISHEHSDHFHEPTLAEFDRATAIYFPDFPNRRIPRRLSALGFSNIHPMPFGQRFEIGHGMALTCYEPASLWNDSIVLIEVDGFRLLNLNDAGLNRRIAGLVGRVDAVASAFTPGASGYPLTWAHLSHTQQDAILDRACGGMLEMLRAAVQLYGCGSLLPYAGHFALWHPVHRRYLPRMRKNTLDDVKRSLMDMPLEVVDLLPGENWRPATRQIERRWQNRQPFYDRAHQVNYLERTFDQTVFDRHHGRGGAGLTPEVLDAYFLRLNDVPEMVFCEDLELEVTVTDLTLERVEFTRRYDIRSGQLAVVTEPRNREANLTMRVPRTVLARIVEEDLSWDESHIGYWCGFSRSPDVFHGGFWRLLQAPYYRRASGVLPRSAGQHIDPQTGIGDLVERHGAPAERILRRYGMYCGGCHRASAETIRQAAGTHGIDSIQTDRLVAELNAALGMAAHG